MKKEFRIKKALEIEEIMKEQISANALELRMFIKYNNEETSHFRYAISVGKKIGNAVNRNYQKRRLRAIFKDNQNNIPENVDIFVVAKPSIKDLDYSSLNKLFNNLLKKCLSRKRRKQ